MTIKTGLAIIALYAIYKCITWVVDDEEESDDDYLDDVFRY